MNPFIYPIEKQVGDIQEEMRTTLEQVKDLENIIAYGDIKVDKSDQLQDLYIIKLKCDICMLETNEQKFSKKKKLTYN